MSCYTGHLFEEEVVGKCLWIWNAYVPFDRSLATVKASQPKNWDPHDPSTPVSNDLHALVVDLLDEEYDNVSFFTAVGSPLDYYHGVDAFIEYHGQVVTLDVTINKHKDSYKADVIIGEDDVYNDEGKINQKRLLIKAQEIVHYLRRV